MEGRRRVERVGGKDEGMERRGEGGGEERWEESIIGK
jgi:hypothetical protein